MQKALAVQGLNPSFDFPAQKAQKTIKKSLLTPG